MKHKPESFGWMKRPELNRRGIEVWELPDGKLYAHSIEDGPLLIEKIIQLPFLNIKDRDNGEV